MKSAMKYAGAPLAAFLLAGVVTLSSCAPAAEEADVTTALPNEEIAETTPSGTQTPINNFEEPCIRAGGLCVLESDCPEGRLTATKGLCPAQRARGVECCYGLSIKERHCSARGGVCRPKQKCGRSLWEKADDCASEETCCVLVS